MRCFFYGTLMDEDVLRAVLGRPLRELTTEPAILSGYRRMVRQGRGYPIIVRSAAAVGCVEGLVVDALTARDLNRLDRFEGGDYNRAYLAVEAGRRGSIGAWAFVARPSVRIGCREWSLEDWRRRYKPAFLQSCAARAGRASAEPIATVDV